MSEVESEQPHSAKTPDAPVSAARALSRLARVAARIEEWQKGPAGQLGLFAWLLCTGAFSVLAVVESHYCAPRRLAVAQREQAMREGWFAEPKVWVSYGLGDCRIVNRDSRPIREIAIARYLFRVDLDEPCSASEFYGGGVRGSASSLDPGEHLAEDPKIGPALQEAVRDAAANGCPAGHACIAVVECRARYHRAADLRLYARSGWAVYEPTRAAHAVPAETLISIDSRQHGERMAWKEPRYQKAFSCVEQLVAERKRLEGMVDAADQITSALVPEQR